MAVGTKRYADMRTSSVAFTGSIPLALIVTFSRPVLLLALAAIAAPVLISRWAARRGHRVAPLGVALQCAAVAFVALALAGPAAPVGPGQRKPVLILQDVSSSCRVQRDRAIELPPDVPVERLAFASSVAANAADLDPNRTNLSPVLRLAAARGADLAGVVIHTDGRFTDHWPPAAEVLAQAHLPVAIVPMDSPPGDARIAEFDARRRPDGAVQLRVTVRSDALYRRRLRVRRIHPSSGAAGALVDRTLDLLADQPATITITDTPPAGSAAAYRAELTPALAPGAAMGADAFPENDSAEAATLPIRRTVAAIGLNSAENPPPGRGVLAGLQGLDVQPVRADQTGADVNWWMDFSAVVLADANGQVLARPARAGLAEYVRSGGALVLLGAGPHGSPADRDDPLNLVAALVANPYERKPLRLIVILDASGSMAEASGPAGRVKFAQAVEAVASLRQHLTEADSLSVITFSDDANQVYDSGSGPPDFGVLAEALSKVRPGGSTDVGKPLNLAASQAVPAGRDALVLVVSDLRTKPFDPQAMADAFGRRGLSLAVAAIASAGETAPTEAPPLEALVRLLKGTLVAPPRSPEGRQENLAGLAKVFAGLLRQTRGDALRRGQFPAAVIRPLLGLAVSPLPEVRAYLLAAPQGGAEVVAQVAGEHDPLLAVRQVGLGRSVTLVMPAGAGLNPAWVQSGELARVVGRAVRWSLRPALDGRFDGQARRQDGRIRVTIEARDANGPINGLDPAGRIVPVAAAPGEAGASFPLVQTAPGHYEGDAGDPGTLAGVEVRAGGSTERSPQADSTSVPPGGRVVWQDVLSAGAPAELAQVGPDAVNLSRLAELTGGRIVNGQDLGAFGQRLAAARRRDLWPALLAVAVALMLAEWAVTRVRRRT